VQHSEVTRQPCRAVSAQGGECSGNGPAHEREGRAVRGETDGVGSAPVESRSDACDERGVVGEPPIHVSDPLDREPAPRQDRFQRGQPGVRCVRQGRRLLPYFDVVSDPAGHDAADAGEPEVDLARHVTGYGRPSRGVIAKEDYGRLPGQDREPGAC
jgi:hypothetical protein